MPEVGAQAGEELQALMANIADTRKLIAAVRQRLAEHPDDVNLADIGDRARANARANARIKKLRARGHRETEIEDIEELRGVTVHLVGSKQDLVLDKVTGQREHGGGISTLGGDAVQKRLWYPYGAFEADHDDAMQRLRHGAVELDLWWRKTEELLQDRHIRAPTDTENSLPTMRQWMRQHRKQARQLARTYHEAAQARYPVATTSGPRSSGRWILGTLLVLAVFIGGLWWVLPHAETPHMMSATFDLQNLWGAVLLGTRGRPISVNQLPRLWEVIWSRFPDGRLFTLTELHQAFRVVHWQAISHSQLQRDLAYWLKAGHVVRAQAQTPGAHRVEYRLAYSQAEEALEQEASRYVQRLESVGLQPALVKSL
jgi:hypothetical protein